MRFLLLCCFVFLIAVSAMGQRKGNPARAGDASLQAQFDTMLMVSNRYQEFKVVRRVFLEAFMKNVGDSLATYTSRIGELEREVASLQDQLDASSGEVGDRDKRITALENERDSIGLLGMELSKSTYSLIMWALVIGLLIALLVALASTRIAAGNNNELKQERDKLSAELEQSRRSRLTIEQELRRQLQDEINKRNG